MSAVIAVPLRALPIALLVAAGAVHAQPPAATSHPVVHVEILGRDAPRLQRFYTEVFGWAVTLNPAGYGYVPVAPAPPVTLTGGIGAGPQGQPLAIFYVKVEDPDTGVVLGRYKWIRASFLSSVLDSGSHWLNRPIVPNQLADGVELFAVKP